MQVALSFPPTNTGMLQWSQNVVNLITPSPATYNLVTADVTALTHCCTMVTRRRWRCVINRFGAGQR